MYRVTNTSQTDIIFIEDQRILPQASKSFTDLSMSSLRKLHRLDDARVSFIAETSDNSKNIDKTPAVKKSTYKHKDPDTILKPSTAEETIEGPLEAIATKDNSSKE